MDEKVSTIPTPLALGYAAARRAAPEHRDFDDIAQEAAIRVAQVVARNPDIPPAYLAGVARHRVLDILAGRPYTGTTSGRNAVDPLRRPETAGLDGLGDEEGSYYLPVREPGFEDVDWSTFASEISAAIETIPCTTETPKQVARLVASGMSASEAGRTLGFTWVGGVKAWQLARKHLQVALAHLHDEVAA